MVPVKVRVGVPTCRFDLDHRLSNAMLLEVVVAHNLRLDEVRVRMRVRVGMRDRARD